MSVTISEILDIADIEASLGGRTTVIELTNVERMFATTAWKTLRDTKAFNHLPWMSADQLGHYEFYSAQWPTVIEAIDHVVKHNSLVPDIANALKAKVREAVGVE